MKAPKCTFAQLQPVHNSFSQVGPVKMVLEENLRRHVTLSIGDILQVSLELGRYHSILVFSCVMWSGALNSSGVFLSYPSMLLSPMANILICTLKHIHFYTLQVWYRGTCHELRVNVMQPGPFGSLVDTDVEVDLDTSLEYNQSQSQQQQSKQQQAAPVVRTVASGHAAASAVVESAGVFRTLAGQGSLSGHNSSQANVPKAGEKREKRELPPEPAEGEPAIKCRLKHPTGITITRSLRPEDPMWVLFELAANELQLASANPITLTTRFPARCLAYEESKDLSASELDLNWQEMFMVSVDS